MRRYLLLLLALLMPLCSCGRLVEGEYRIVTEHVETSLSPETAGRVFEIHTYSGLKRAIQNLVNGGAAEGIIRAVEYSGGIRDDVSKACLEVARSSPMGTYAVEYMTHSVTRILSYDEVQIHISYTRSQEEIEAVRSVPTMNDFYQMLNDGLDAGTEYMAFQIVTLSVNDRSLRSYISNYYRQHPERLLSLPDASVSFYPSEDYVQKIVTLELDYHTPLEGRDTLLESLDSKARGLIRKMDDSRAPQLSMLCCMAVYRQLERLSINGRTAYDVLVSGFGNSEGCAMAYQLLCTRCGIPCQVVSGRLNSETHYWNLIRLEDGYYHVDCSACVNSGLLSGFLKRDSDMWGSYWWESEAYPAADGSLTAADVLEQYQLRNADTSLEAVNWPDQGA